jgi:hypothetical protein
MLGAAAEEAIETNDAPYRSGNNYHKITKFPNHECSDTSFSQGTRLRRTTHLVMARRFDIVAELSGAADSDSILSPK